MKGWPPLNNETGKKDESMSGRKDDRLCIVYIIPQLCMRQELNWPSFYSILYGSCRRELKGFLLSPVVNYTIRQLIIIQCTDQSDGDRDTDRWRQRYRQIQIDRDTDRYRQIEIQTDTDRRRYRQIEIDRDTDRWRQKQTEIQTDTDREGGRQLQIDRDIIVYSRTANH